MHNEGTEGCRARDTHADLLLEDPTKTDCLEKAAFDGGVTLECIPILTGNAGVASIDETHDRDQ